MHDLAGGEPDLEGFDVIPDVLEIIDEGLEILVIVVEILEERTSLGCNISANGHNLGEVSGGVNSGSISQRLEEWNHIDLLSSKLCEAALHTC